MLSRLFQLLTIAVLATLWTAVSFAQVDPSSALLLNSGSRTYDRDSAVDSGRYTVKPKSEAPARREPIRDRDDVRPTVRKTQTVEAQPTPAAIPMETPVPDAVAGQNAPQVIEENPEDKIPTRAKNFDRRLNLLEISVAPGYLYNNSESSFFYRRYHSAAPVIGADARVWLHPGFALQVGYLGTLSGHVNDSFDGSKNVPATQQWSTAGIRSRKIFFNDGAFSTMVFGIDYLEYQFRVPSDAVLRGKLKSTGVQLSLESEIAVNPRRAWTVGFTFQPKLQHKESATSLEFESGANVDANGVGISLGGRIQFERQDAIFWKLSHTIEKDLFSGDATVSDPMTGVVPASVAVTNSFSILQFGYTWGN